MDLITTEATKHEYYNHWVNINFIEYPMGRSKKLGIKSMPALKEAIWNEEWFWLPLVRQGIEDAAPEELYHVAPPQYVAVMELFTNGLLSALNVKPATPEDWAGMMAVTK